MGKEAFADTFKTIPYWKASVDWPPPSLSIPLMEQADVVVVGSGFTGLSAARSLALSGREVAVLERMEIGGGASSRNGGIVHPTLGVSAAELIARFGREGARKLYAIVLDGFEFLRTLIIEEGIDCHFNARGAFEAAIKPSHLERMRTRQATLAEVFGHQTKVVGPEERPAYVSSDTYCGGWFDPLGATLHPARLTRGLAVAAGAAGAHLYAHTPVLQIESDGGWHVITTPHGRIRARQVILATNGYTDDLIPQLRRRIIPIRTTAIATAPLQGAQIEELFPGRCCFWDSYRLFHYYQVTHDGRLVFGGIGSLIDPSVQRDAEALQARMARLFPALRRVKIDYAWDGMIGLTFDRMPHLGVMDGIYYALGYNGDGVLLGCYLGAQLAALVAGEVPEMPLQKVPFPEAFFYRRRPWFATWARTFYGLLDRIGL
jgi:glycine/D-amino acid oxidase-like deaminating enzyme